jgi:hypothetical protein
LKGRGCGYSFFPKFTGAIRTADGRGLNGLLFHAWMMHIETVKQMDGVSALSQIAGHVQQTQRLCPEIIGRKIMDPGVNKNQFGWHIILAIGCQRSAISVQVVM